MIRLFTHEWGLLILFSWFCYRKIGGYTGDTFGAVCKITEIIPTLVAIAWLHG